MTGSGATSPTGRSTRSLRGRSVEGWRLGEHLGLEGPERGPGVDAQLLGERLACPAQCRQSTRLPLGPVEGKRQEPPALLPERVLGDQCLELTDDHGSVSQLESRLQTSLAGHGVQLGEPQGLGLDPWLAEILGVRRTAPQPESVVQRAHRVGRCETRRGVHGSFEAPRIDGVGPEPKDVPGCLAGDDTVALAGHGLGLEASSQVTHVRLEGAGWVGGWVVTPHTVGETFGRDDLVTQDHQGREDGALTSPAEVYDRAVACGRELAEHPESHRRLAVHPAPHSASSNRRPSPRTGEVRPRPKPPSGPAQESRGTLDSATPAQVEENDDEPEDEEPPP